MGIEQAGMAPVVLVWCLVMMFVPYTLAKTEEQIDAVGSKRPIDEVEPTDWKVAVMWLVGLFGVFLTGSGIAWFARDGVAFGVGVALLGGLVRWLTGVQTMEERVRQRYEGTSREQYGWINGWALVVAGVVFVAVGLVSSPPAFL